MAIRGPLLPSDILYVELLNRTKIEEGKLGYQEIDLTELYNWYVRNIESLYNSNYKQYNTSLFEFIVEYYILIWSISTKLDSRNGGESTYDVEEIDLVNIGNFMDVNGIMFRDPNNPSTSTDLILLDLYNSKMLSNFIDRLKIVLNNNGISPNRASVEDDNNPFFVIPIGWSIWYPDIATIGMKDPVKFKQTYPYNVSPRIRCCRLTREQSDAFDEYRVYQTIEMSSESTYHPEEIGDLYGI